MLEWWAGKRGLGHSEEQKSGRLVPMLRPPGGDQTSPGQQLKTTTIKKYGSRVLERSFLSLSLPLIFPQLEITISKSV